MCTCVFFRYGLSRQKSKSQSCTERTKWWVKPAVTILCCYNSSCCFDSHLITLSSGPSEDESSPAAEKPQKAGSVEGSPKEKPSPQASPEGRAPSKSPPSKSPASGSHASGSPASSSSDDDSSSSDEDEHHGALRKLRSSVAQIKVSMD